MNLIAFKVNFHNQSIRHRELHRPTHGAVAFRLIYEAVNVTAVKIRHRALSLTLIAWINLSTLTAAAPLRISPVKSPILSDCSRCRSAWSQISWLLSSLVMYTLPGSPQPHAQPPPPPPPARNIQTAQPILQSLVMSHINIISMHLYLILIYQWYWEFIFFFFF